MRHLAVFIADKNSLADDVIAGDIIDRTLCVTPQTVIHICVNVSLVVADIGQICIQQPLTVGSIVGAAPARNRCIKIRTRPAAVDVCLPIAGKRCRGCLHADAAKKIVPRIRAACVSRQGHGGTDRHAFCMGQSPTDEILYILHNYSPVLFKFAIAA